MNASRIKRPVSRLSRVIATLSALVSAATLVSSCSAAIIYESAAADLTGIPYEQVQDQTFLGARIASSGFNGSRFFLANVALVERVGALIAGPAISPTNDVFAAIVRLDNASDFPNSSDLSTADVLGVTLLPVPRTSSDSYGALRLRLEPGWWGIVVGSGRFGAFGSGAALLNNTDSGAPNSFGFILGAGWGPRPGGMRFIVEGALVPEPNAAVITITVVLGLSVTNANRPRWI